jgi:hypothetical protein
VIAAAPYCHCMITILTGNDFTEDGFGSIIEYLYTGAVLGVTCGIPDCDQLQATLQAAQYFDVSTLGVVARNWAQTNGITIEG